MSAAVAAAAAVDTKLIHSIINRLGEKLPAQTGRPFDEFLLDAINQQNVRCIVELAPRRIHVVARAILALFENVHRSVLDGGAAGDNPGASHQPAAAAAGTDSTTTAANLLIQSQTFLLKLLFVCLNANWRAHLQTAGAVPAADADTATNTPRAQSRPSPGAPSTPSDKAELVGLKSAVAGRPRINSTASRFGQPQLDEHYSLAAPKIYTASQASLAAQDLMPGAGVAGPPPLDDKIASSVFIIAARYLTQPEVASASVKPVAGQPGQGAATLASDSPIDFVGFLGLAQCTADSMSAPVAPSLTELHSAAQRLFFYISASNWDMLFAVIKSKLASLAVSPDDSADTSELRVLEFCHLDSKKLASVLSEIGNVLRLLKKTAAMTIPSVLRKTIWNWIELYPLEFSALHQQQRRFEGVNDAMFEFYNTLADNNKKKAVVWPCQTTLLMLCPDIIGSIVASDFDVNGNTKKKVFAYTYFLETIKQSFRSTKLTEVAVVCYIDICRAAVSVASTVANSSLRKMAAEFDSELKDKLFVNSTRVFTIGDHQVEQHLVVDFFLACFRRNPVGFVRATLPVFLEETSPALFRLVMVKAFCLIATQGTKNPGYPTLSELYASAAGPLRTLLQDCVSKYGSAAGITGGKQATTTSSDLLSKKYKHKPRDDDSTTEILISLLRLYLADPQLAIHNEMPDTHRDDTQGLLMGIVQALQEPAYGIRNMAAETLIVLHQPRFIKNWTPASVSAAAGMWDFWVLSSHVTGAVAKQLLDCSRDDSTLTKHHLEFLLQLLISRVEYIAQRREPFQTKQQIAAECYNSCTTPLEAALLISLCAADPEICSLAMSCVEELCAESMLTEYTDENGDAMAATQFKLPNTDIYRQFIGGGAATGTGTILGANAAMVTGGRVAQQKKIRKMLRALEKHSDGITLAWGEAYRRWQHLSALAMGKVTEGSDAEVQDSKKKSAHIFSSGVRLVPHTIIRTSTVTTSVPEIPEDKGEWQNYTGFLCSLGGCCLPARSPGKSAHSGSSDQLTPSLVDLFFTDVLDMLVSENAMVRESIKEMLGSELSAGLYPLFFRHLATIISKLLFDDKGDIVCNDRTTFHVEQVISVLKMILERTQEHSDSLSAVDFGAPIQAYVNYLNRLGRSPIAMRCKIKMCQLVETLLVKREYLCLREEIKFRNKLLETVVEWTSDFSTVKFDGASGGEENLGQSRNVKLSRDLDLMCMKAIVALLVQLPLQPVDSANDMGDLVEARSRLFYKYFQFFLQLLKRCRREHENDGAKSVESSKDLDQLKDYTILALSNLLSANIDCGLRHALSVGYHEDTKTRTAFMLVLTNILDQGAEFEGLADTFITDRYQKLVELLYEPDLSLTLAFVDACAAQEMDDVASLLFTIFESRNQTLKLLKAVIEREVCRTDTAANLFRRNSMATKLITVYARAYGGNYLRKVLEPVWDEIVSPRNAGRRYEVDPGKLQNAQQNPDEIVVQRENVKWLTGKFLEAILGASEMVPVELKNICAFLTQSVTATFTDAKINVVLGGFFFLRFVCPAIVLPELQTDNVDQQNVRRGCVLASKIIQNLSNEIVFGGKEAHMKEFNVFMEQNFAKRMAAFLSEFSKWPMPNCDVPVLMNKIDDADIQKLHRYAFTSVDTISRDLSARKRSTVASPHSWKSPIATTTEEMPARSHQELQIPAQQPQSFSSSTSTRKALDALIALLGQLGAPIETAHISTSHSNADGGVHSKHSINQLYVEFMARNELRDVDAIREKRIFYEGGLSKDRHQLFYYIARRVSTSSVDFELFMYSILQTMKPFGGKPFSLVVDLSQFGEENEIQSQWIQQFLQIMPDEYSTNLVHVLVYSPSSAFRKYAKKIQRLMSSKLMRKIVFVNSLNEFNQFISPMELRLPKSTVVLEQEWTFSASVTIMSNFRGNTSVSIRLTSDAIQLISTKKQDIFGIMSALINDVIPLSTVDDVSVVTQQQVTTEKGIQNTEEFIIKCDGGRTTLTFTSPKRDVIVQAIRAGCAKLQLQTKQLAGKTSDRPGRQIRPSDVPGTLLNMALLNLGSDDADLRLAAYNLLSWLSAIFNFDLGNQLLMAKGMLIPGNNSHFIRTISERLALTEPRLTVEFLRECFIGFEMSTTEQSKHICLEYMVPWLANIAQIQQLNNGDPDLTKTQTDDIMRMLMELTVKEKQMYPSVQSKLWHALGSSDDVVNMLMGPFLQFAIDHGPGSEAAEIMADTCVTLSFANIHLVSGRIVSRLRKAINDTSTKPTAVLTDHQSWKEICVLLRFCLTLSFNNRLYIQQYLPELLHVIVLVVASGTLPIRAAVHGLLVNIVHSMCTSSLLLNDKQRKPLKRLLHEFSEPKFRLLFGASANSGNVSNTGSNKTEGSLSADKLSLQSLDVVVTSLMDAMFVGAPSLDVSTTWRARWISLATAQAFQFNPALQPRAFVELGCLSRGEMDDDLVYQILAALRRALLYFDDTDCHLICSIITALTSMVDGCPVESRFLRSLFWLGVAVIQISHVPLFTHALALVQTVLRNLNSKGFFVQQSPAQFLLRSREPLAPAADQIDAMCGISFNRDFNFSVAVLLLKGMRHPATKAMVTATLIDFFDITSKFVYQSFYRQVFNEADDDVDEADVTLTNNNTTKLPGYADASLLGYIAPLLPVVDTAVLRDIFWRFGVALEELEEQAPAYISTKVSTLERVKSGQKYHKILECLAISDSTAALMLASLMVTCLENAEYESETLFVYNFLAEMAASYPQIVHQLMDRLLPKMTYVLETSHAQLIIDAVHRILYSLSLMEDVDRLEEWPSSSELASPTKTVRSLHGKASAEFVHNSSGGGHLSSIQHGLATWTRTLTSRSMKKRPMSPAVLANAPNSSMTTSASSASLGGPSSPLKQSHQQQQAVNPLADVGFVALMSADCGTFGSVSRNKKYAVCTHVSQLIELLLT